VIDIDVYVFIQSPFSQHDVVGSH